MTGSEQIDGLQAKVADREESLSVVIEPTGQQAITESDLQANRLPYPRDTAKS